MNETLSVPACVGIILDGNRRWAKARGLPAFEGHRAGMEALTRAVRFVSESGVRHLIVYAFSTENWNRKEEEVAYLMDLFRESMQKQMRAFGKEGVRARFVGQRERFSDSLRQAMDEVEEETKGNDSLTLYVCLSYGGRAEIVAAANAAAAEGEVTEETLMCHMWTAGMPDPDIVIRTSGEKRLSGFLPWQTVYSELFFINTFWPDFSKEEFDAILVEYAQRERRRGK
jgi:undecaprenyl diphosphate synthase